MNSIEKWVMVGRLTLTGSRVFSSSEFTEETDYDYFGFFTQEISNQLEEIGFEIVRNKKEQDNSNYVGDSACQKSIRFKKGNQDVFLFHKNEDLFKYTDAHNVAKEVLLRDALPDKGQFLGVFKAMTGFGIYE